MKEKKNALYFMPEQHTLPPNNLAYTFAQQQIYSVQKLQTFKSIPRGSAQVIFHVLKGSFLSTYRPFHFIRGYAHSLLISYKHGHHAWWHYGKEMLSALLALYEGNTLVIGSFPSQRACNMVLWYFLFVCLKHFWTNSQVADDKRYQPWWSCDVTVVW